LSSSESVANFKIMKKIVIFCSVIIAAAVLVFAVEETEKTSTTTATTEHHVVKPSDLKWGEAPPGLPAGGKMAVLNGDPGQAGPFTVRLKAPAGYKIMPHTHPTAERVTVISGNFRIGMAEKFEEANMQEMGPGSYIVLPAGMAHFVKVGAKESVVQIDSEGPFQINYLNPADDPRNAKK
jgi:quercetin dioxygenase-like cupin family protein